MNLQLKSGEIFEHPETGQEYTALFGGMKNFNLSVDDESINLKIDFFASKEKMNEGRSPIFSKTFSFRNDNPQNPGEYTRVQMIQTSGSYIGIELEKAVYNTVLEDDVFKNFELVV